MAGLFLVAVVEPGQTQPYGLTQRPAVGRFLNGALPPADAAATGWQVVQAFPGLSFDDPTALWAEPRSNRLYVTERSGRIYFFTNNPTTTNKTLFLDLRSVTLVVEDSGVLGLAFHPEFGVPGSTNRGYVYVAYQFIPVTIPNPQLDTPSYNRVSRFTVPDGSLVADRNSEQVLINQYDRHNWHNGGAMFFGPDGMLYITNGDEGSSNDPYNQAQKLNSGLFSGVLRIDVDQNPSRSHPIRRQPLSGATPPNGWPPTYSSNYFIPNDNPWLNTNGTILEEFYAIGLRSPHRMTYDPPTGRIWVGDVGQAAIEEVDIIEKGGNYQWAYREGSIAGPKSKPSPLIGVDKPPIHSYARGEGNCVIGGYVYRGTEHAAFLTGKYIFGDNGSGKIWAMTYTGVGSPTITYLATMPSGSLYTGLSSFGVDQNNELYMTKMGAGAKIYKLARTGATPPLPPPLLSQTGVFTNLATMTPSPALIPFDVASPLWSDAAAKYRWLAVPTNTTIGFFTNGNWTWPTGTVLVKHFNLPVNETNPAAVKRLETRLLARGTNGSWYGLTYKWRTNHTDADLLDDGLNETNLITTASGVRTQVWYYPSRQDCQTCHNVTAGQVLGLRTCQMNRDLAYPSTGVTDNQLRALNHIGLFSPSLVESNIVKHAKAAPLEDDTAPLELRARSYLDSNCAHCHRPNGVRAWFDARMDTPLASQNLINGQVEDTLGVTGAKVVAPGSLSQSLLHFRMSTVGQHQMPPLARNLVDTQAVDLVGEWINSLPQTVGLPSPWDHQDIGPVGVAGDANHLSGTFTVIGSGVDIWAQEDSFHFMYRPLVGDGVLTARVQSLANADPWGLAGVMIRQSLTAGSQHALMAVTPQNGLSFTRRLTANSSSSYTGAAGAAAPYWMRLTRTNNTFTALASSNGVTWTTIGTSQTITMSGTVYAGLALSSHNNSALATAAFNNVSLIGPNVNNPPAISAISPQTIPEDTVAGPLAFTIGDVETAAASLSLSATSSVPALAAVTNIFFSGSGSNRTVTIVPVTNMHGVTTITLRVSDGTNTTASAFLLTIQPINDAPIAVTDSFTRFMSQGLSFPIAGLATNDWDAEDDLLSVISLGSSAIGASITESNDLVRYWPPFGNTNADSFNYVVSDGHGGSATGLVMVAVIPDPLETDILSLTAAGTNVQFQLNGIPGFTYTVQVTENLSPPNWQNLSVVTADGSGLVQVADPLLTNNVTRFYRAVRGIAP